jgi:polyisoprenoid-binding protein YceI
MCHQDTRITKKNQKPKISGTLILRNKTRDLGFESEVFSAISGHKGFDPPGVLGALVAKETLIE